MGPCPACGADGDLRRGNQTASSGAELTEAISKRRLVEFGLIPETGISLSDADRLPEVDEPTPEAVVI